MCLENNCIFIIDTNFCKSLYEFLGSDVREPFELHVSQLLCQHSGWWAEFRDIHLKDKIILNWRVTRKAWSLKNFYKLCYFHNIIDWFHKIQYAYVKTKYRNICNSLQKKRKDVGLHGNENCRTNGHLHRLLRYFWLLNYFISVSRSSAFRFLCSFALFHLTRRRYSFQCAAFQRPAR